MDWWLKWRIIGRNNVVCRSVHVVRALCSVRKMDVGICHFHAGASLKLYQNSDICSLVYIVWKILKQYRKIPNRCVVATFPIRTPPSVRGTHLFMCTDTQFDMYFMLSRLLKRLFVPCPIIHETWKAMDTEFTKVSSRLSLSSLILWEEFTCSDLRINVSVSQPSPA